MALFHIKRIPEKYAQPVVGKWLIIFIHKDLYLEVLPVKNSDLPVFQVSLFYKHHTVF